MLTEKVRTGIDALDEAWSGLFRGAAYLLYGRMRDGRNLLTLQMVHSSVEAGEICMLVSPRNPRDIAVQGRSVGLDVDDACRGKQLQVLRTPASLDADPSDEAIDQALRSLAEAASGAGAGQLIIEDFTPFVRFQDFDIFRAALLGFFDTLAQSDTTTVLCLGEPANVHSREIVAFLREHIAGAVHLTAKPGDRESTARILSLHPPPGSFEQDVTLEWDLARLLRPAGAPYASVGDGTAGGRRKPQGHEAPAGNPALEVTVPPAGPSPIQYFDPHNPYGPAPRVEDPFANVGRPPIDFSGARFLVGEPAAPSRAAAQPGPTGAAPAHRPAAARPAISPARARQSDTAQLPTGTADAFAAGFEAARRAHAASGAPFLLVALRVDTSDEAFARLASAARAASGAEAVVLAHARSQRLALVLPGRTRDDVRALLVSIRDMLRQQGQQRAMAALHSASLVVVPNGGSFKTAGDFLAIVRREG